MSESQCSQRWSKFHIYTDITLYYKTNVKLLNYVAKVGSSNKGKS